MEAEDAMYYDEEEDLMTDADLERALDALHEEAPEEVTDLLKVMNENQIISWEEAERILGDTSNEPIKSSLPQQTRPTEPDNDTDVDNCIRRLLKNDPKLVEINLNNMKRTPVPQIRRIIEAMRENTYLEKLSLANMGLYEADISVLCDILEENDTLRVLNVETNYLSGEFFAKLLRAALKFQSLEELKAVNQGVSFSTISEREIIDAVFQNRGITKISINLRLPEGRHKIEQATIRNQEIRRILRRQAAAEAEAAAKASEAAKKAVEPAKTSPGRKKFVGDKNDNVRPSTSEQPKAAAPLTTRPMRRKELKIPKPLAVIAVTPKPVLREEPPRILAGNLKELKKKWDSMENEESPPPKPKVEDIPKRRTSLLAQKWEEVNNNTPAVVEELPLIAPRLKKKVVVVGEAADGVSDMEESAKISLKWNKKSKGGEEKQEPSKITAKLKKMATIDEPSAKGESKYLSRWKKTATIDETSTSDEVVESTKEEPKWKNRIHKDDHTAAAAATSKAEAPKAISAWKKRAAAIDDDSSAAPPIDKKEEIPERKEKKMDAKREEQPKVTPVWKKKIDAVEGPMRAENSCLVSVEETPRWKKRIAKTDKEDTKKGEAFKSEELQGKRVTTVVEESLPSADEAHASVKEDSRISRWKRKDVEAAKQEEDINAKVEGAAKTSTWKKTVAAIDGPSVNDSMRESLPSWKKKAAAAVDEQTLLSSERKEIPRWKRSVGANKVTESTNSTIGEKTKATADDRTTANKTSPLPSTNANAESNCEPENPKEEAPIIKTRKVVQKKKKSETEPEAKINGNDAKHSAEPSAAEKAITAIDADVWESVRSPLPPLTTRPHRLKKSLADMAPLPPPPARKSPPPLMPKKMPPKPAPKPKADLTVGDVGNVGDENGGDNLVDNHNNTREEDADPSTLPKSTAPPPVPTKPKTRQRLRSRFLDD